MKKYKYYLESRSRGICYMKYVNGRLTGLVTFCVENAIYNMLLKERRDTSERKRRKKT
jgi:ribosomal protein S26